MRGPCSDRHRSLTPTPPACHRARGRPRTSPSGGRINASHPCLPLDTMEDGKCGRDERMLRWGRTKEWDCGQISCQEFRVTIREGHHHISLAKNLEHFGIRPSVAVAMLIFALHVKYTHSRPSCPSAL